MEGYGLMIILNGFLGSLGVIELSMREATLKYLAEYMAANNRKGVNEVFNSAIFYQIIVGAFLSILIIIWRHNILIWLKVSSNSLDIANSSLLITSLGFPISLVGGILSSMLFAVQRFDIFAKITTISGIALILGLVIILLLGGGLVLVMVWNVAILIVTNFAYLSWIRKEYEWINFKIKPSKSSTTKLLSFGIFTQLAKTSSIVYDQVIKLVLSNMFGAAAVSYFAIPQRLINAFQGLIDKIAKVMFPIASELSAINDLSRLQRGHVQSTKYLMIFITPVYLTVAMFSRSILNIWIGPEFSQNGWIILSILALSFWLISWTMIPSNIAYGLGKAKLNAIFSTFVAIANLLLFYIFAHYFGMNGAILTLLIVQIQVPFFVVMISNLIIPKSGMNLLRESYIKPTLLGISCIVLGYGLNEAFSSDYVKIFFGATLNVSIYYLLTYYFGIMPAEEFKKLYSSLKNIFTFA